MTETSTRSPLHSDHFAQLDDEIRLALLKVAEICMSSQPEPQPGNVIKLSTPVSEMPPPLIIPKLRLSVPDAQAAAHASNGVPSAGPVKLVIPNKKKLLPAQKSGLSDMDLKAITNALAKMVSFPLADPPSYSRCAISKAY